MKLRKLEKKDAPLMLEWMHDASVTNWLQADFKHMTIENCLGFIERSKDETQDLHLAIVDDEDNYMGTVSLKHIENHKAEFAIVVRAEASVKGYASFGMKEIIRIGLEERQLKNIYWCVSPNNQRAIKFYNKNGYKQVTTDRINTVYYTQTQIDEFIWYLVE